MSIDKLTGLIYDAVLDEAAVAPMAAALADHLHADSSWLLIGMSQHEPPAATCVHGLDDTIVHAYETEFHAYDPWKAMVGKTPLNTPMAMERLVGCDMFQRSRVYQELIRGRIDVLHCMALAFNNGSSISGYALQRGKRSGAFDQSDEAALVPYVEHLQRLSLAIERSATVEPQSLETLVSLPDPVIISDKNGRPVYCSVDGKLMLDAGLVIARNHSGRMHSIDRRLSLEAMIRDAATRGLPSVHWVDPPSGAYTLAIDPCHHLPLHASITIRDRHAHAGRKAAAIARDFGLTGAEELLLMSLTTGLTIEEHCMARGTAISTARSQLHSIFAKTETDRQSELMVRVLEAPTR